MARRIAVTGGGRLENRRTVLRPLASSTNIFPPAPQISSLYGAAEGKVFSLVVNEREQIHVDKAFIGVNGVSGQGISVNNAAEAGVKRRMVRGSLAGSREE